MRRAQKLVNMQINSPVAVRDAIVPIFQELSKPGLVEKCLQGKTKNCNEALNAFTWKHLPKDVFVESYVLGMGGCMFCDGFIIEYLEKLDAIILIIYSSRPFNVVCEH